MSIAGSTNCRAWASTASGADEGEHSADSLTRIRRRQQMAAELRRPVLNVGIITTNFKSMARFYTGLFGFEPLRPLAFPGSGTVHRFKAGESILRIMVPEQTPPHDGASGEFLYHDGLPLHDHRSDEHGRDHHG